ncbi:DUF2062 domain-containing protein [Novosphingobium cyanobacteriorum]|uniref:DUF2062 domain-containing protein n=1 Tax=Novosphingobium cyanobacteriorum TaxID=3024215 RepID=A0ABT6CIW9_9SPHN|nr:DUF2062 domain-containing protein [Novosphingobium cyanobacteriorum]MDF8333469.1 DUF2062 domain-containing protein [Novosphingobium cyanobacteriorum]
MYSRIARWAQANMPTREQMEQNRFARPLAARAELWRFTRRSVPRGVAVGLFIGIFAMIPGVQIVGAALMCVPFRGNIPIAALMTFVSIPPTTLFVFLPGAIWVGNQFGFHADISTVSQLMQSGAGVKEWLAWLGTDAAPSLLLGLGVIGLASALLGYAVSAVGWRWWTAHKRRTRLLQAAARDFPES